MAKVSWKSFVLESFQGSMDDVVAKIGLYWEPIKGPLINLIASLLRIAVYICLAMSLMVFIEKLYMGIVIMFVKLLKKKPEKRYKWKPICDDDLEVGNAAFPLVLVQIPMCNEKQVYKISIGAACNLSWPTDRLLVQVLDDSTDPVIKDMIGKECIRWASQGINIRYQSRETREGYKAGNLKEGMKQDYVKEYEYVAIFYADFEPEPDFLRRTIPFLMHNPKLALVQCRWAFANWGDCVMTKIQEMSLGYHFTVEQEVGSVAFSFFGFNGSAGVWRISAMEEAGGWKERTTVEDMDLAVRAGLKGWQFLYLSNLEVKSELPSTLKAYRLQQHRWCCGPANLFRKTAMDIIRTTNVHLWKKLYLIYSFFFVRKIVLHAFFFFFYNVILPLTIFVPQVHVPKWGTTYIPLMVTLLNTIGIRRSFHLFICMVVFENVITFHRTKGVIIGLLEAKRVNEWVVTEKFGDSFKNKSMSKAQAVASPRFRLADRILPQELGFAIFLFACGFYNLFYRANTYFIYLFLQAIGFTIVGFGYVGI